MEVTHRYWGGVILAGLLAGGAWLLAEPLLLVGAAVLGGSLLVHQYRFTRAVLQTTDNLTLTQSVSHDRVTTDETTPVVLRAMLPDPASIDVTVDARPPVAAHTTEDERHLVTIDTGTQKATATFSLQWPVAGKFELDAPVVTLRDPAGFFRSTVPRGPTATVTVVPRRPRDLHVGAGGERLSTAFGEHKTGRRGVGLDPAEIRQYVPGDTARQIDWKATARTGSPHVREYDAETDLSTVLVLDHRSSMAMGTQGQTKLDYLRHVALAYTDHARSNTEPIALYGIGNDGMTVHDQSDASTRHFTQVDTHLHDLVPTEGSPAQTAIHRQTRPHQRRTPSDARAAATKLQVDDSAFGTTLVPYFTNTQQYLHHIEADPLYNTVRTYLGRTRGSVVTVLLTDDTHRQEVRETVRMARRHSEQVLVFLAPTVLFERGRLEDIESAYEEYVDFEEFRRGLTRIDGVAAFEVGAADRIEAILASTRQTRRNQARSQ
ncbi:DUF58 domain-containing protein [Haladaptatus sp. NG-SE-30]